MMSNTEYWLKRNELKRKAQIHVLEMGAHYGEEIKACCAGSEIFSPGLKYVRNPYVHGTKIQVCDEDSVSAITRLAAVPGRMAVLNFASYKKPGGMFLEGSSAQEESLCHESFLYNVLKERLDYYYWNMNNLNKGLYMDRALYSEDVYFFRDGRQYICDVITCAAPNKETAMKYCNVTPVHNRAVLSYRIKFMLDVAAYKGVNTLILGAWGCGAFGQDPHEVAELFAFYLNGTHKGCFENVVFAIPNGKNENLKAFQRVFR